jgi:ribosomal protein S16
MLNIENINEGKAALSFQVTRDSSQGVIRDVTYTATAIRPVDTRGEWSGTYDLIKIKISLGGALGTGKYSVWVKDSTALKNNKVVEDEVITGDYQPLAGGLEIRFAGEADDTVAALNNEWEIEVFGKYENVDNSSAKAVKMTRIRKNSRLY